MVQSEKRGHLFVISGASGTGKTTLCRVLEIELVLFFSISATTRPQRQGEVSGRDYHFLNQDEFQNMVQNEQLLEWAEVHGNYYGTPKEPIEQRLAEGEDILLDLDTQGAIQLKKSRKDAVLIFLMPPDLDELGRRLRGRGTDPENVIGRRIQRAEEEIAESSKYDHVVVNKDLEVAKNEIKNIIKGKEGS